MSEVTINENTLSGIASAIRNKLGVETTYKPSQMASAISGIETPKLEQRTFTSNGEYLPNYGKNGMSKVIVDVVPSYSAADEGKVVSSGALVPQSSISVSQNGSYDTTLNNQVIVDVVPNLESISISQNGTFTPSVDGFSEVVVDVQPSLGSISISENGTYIPSDVDGFNEVIVSVAGGGGGSDNNFRIAALDVSGAISDNSVSQVGSYAFASNSCITGVYMGAVTKVESYAFSRCSKIENISFPELVTVCANAFAYCSKLTTVELPKCTSISYGGFVGCSSLGTVSIPLCENIGSYVFAYCSMLTNVYAPKCKTIGSSAFSDCSRLTTLAIDDCETLYPMAFYGCSRLSEIVLPKCTNIQGYVFGNNLSLVSVYLLASTVATLASSNAFNGTPMKSGYGRYGSIYVPSSLYNNYIVASNWSYFADRITSYIEE